MDELIIGALIGMGIFGATGGWVAQQKGRRLAEGVILGATLGVIGVFIELFLRTPVE